MNNIDQAIEEVIIETVKESLEHILKEYDSTGFLDEALNHEIIKLGWKLKKLEEAKDIKLKSMMVRPLYVEIRE